MGNGGSEPSDVRGNMTEREQGITGGDYIARGDSRDSDVKGGGGSGDSYVEKTSEDSC